MNNNLYKISNDCPKDSNVLWIKAVFYHSWAEGNQWRPDHSGWGRIQHTQSVAQDTCQGLQGPNILDYWLYLFSSLQVCNDKPCDLLGAACKKDWGKK